MRPCRRTPSLQLPGCLFGAKRNSSASVEFVVPHYLLRSKGICSKRVAGELAGRKHPGSRNSSSVATSCTNRSISVSIRHDYCLRKPKSSTYHIVIFFTMPPTLTGDPVLFPLFRIRCVVFMLIIRAVCFEEPTLVEGINRSLMEFDFGRVFCIYEYDLGGCSIRYHPLGIFDRRLGYLSLRRCQPSDSATALRRKLAMILKAASSRRS